MCLYRSYMTKRGKENKNVKRRVIFDVYENQNLDASRNV